MQIVTDKVDSFSNGDLKKIYAYRKKIFVDQLRWKLSVCDGEEVDQFDHSTAVYIVAKDENDEVIGFARLLPTNTPYLLEQIFPYLANGQILPRSPLIWELSRFAVTGTPIPGRYSSSVAIALLQEAFAFASRNGIPQLIAVSYIGVERLLRQEGFFATRLNAPEKIDGANVCAYWIERNEEHQVCDAGQS